MQYIRWISIIFIRSNQLRNVQFERRVLYAGVIYCQAAEFTFMCVQLYANCKGHYFVFNGRGKIKLQLWQMSAIFFICSMPEYKLLSTDADLYF